MTTLRDCPLGVMMVLGVACALLIALAAWVLAEVCAQRRGAPRIAAAVLALLWPTLLAQALGMVVYPMRHGQGLRLVGLSRLLAPRPAALSVVLVVLTGMGLAASALRLFRARRRQLTPDSVKEALDTLPDAVSFSTQEGRPLLFNTRMDALAHDVFLVAISDEQALWERLCAGEVAPGYAVRDVDARRGHALLLAPDGGAWEFRRQTLVVDGWPVVEAVATDVTDEYGLAAEVARRNAQMEAVNERLRAYGADVTRLTREQEVLAAKVRVHDQVGRALVALRAYERQEPAGRDRAALVGLWRSMARMLKTAGADEDGPTDAWEQLQQAAAAVDVALRCEGELPASERSRAIVVAAVHECLNNAVRHADAHEVRVRLAREGAALVVRIANDGRPPAASAAEAGGLADVRRLVEGASGTMQLTWVPRFELCLCLAGEED